MGDLRQVPLTTLCYVLITIHAGMCLAVSACYEFIEWFAALIGGGDADAFLGTQGDVWDTQWDMFLALIGAITAQLLLSRLHDRQFAQGPPVYRLLQCILHTIY